MDLVRVLAPARFGARAVRSIPRRDTFGSVAAAAAIVSAASGLASIAKEMIPHIREMLKDEGRRAASYREEYEKAKAGLAKARTQTAKERYLKRMIRYEEMMEISNIKLNLIRLGLAQPGPTLEGTAIEMRRNMLSEEWETAEPERKKHIERLVESYDKELTNIQRMVVQFQRIHENIPEKKNPEPTIGATGSRAELIRSSFREVVEKPDTTESLYTQKEGGAADPKGELDELRAEQNLKAAILDTKNPLKPNQALVSGIGGQQFVAQAPMREVCISMYPSRPADSYAGANGIVVPGDDPVLLMRLTAGQNTNFLASTDYEISTELFDYGKYRVVGFMSHAQGNYQVRTATGGIRQTSEVNGVGISIRSISLYNGEELLLPLGDLNANTFGIFPQPDAYPGISSTSLSAFAQQAPYNENRSNRFFVGLRTNPIIEGTARLRAIVRCYVYSRSNTLLVPNGMLTGDTLEVPVSFSILGQMLEDKVFGDPLVPGPASRAGAQVMLGLKDIGTDTTGVQQLQLRNTRYVIPKMKTE